jgi:shikimate kinase
MLTAARKRIILLVGPKGSGKSHIGREFSRQFLARFLRIEGLWQDLQRERSDFLSEAYIAEGMTRTITFIEAELERSDTVTLESTGGFDQFAWFLDSLRHLGDVILVKVEVGLEECLRRIASRDKTLQVAVPDELVVQINAASARMDLDWDLRLRNDPFLSSEEIGRAFAPVLGPRRQRRGG